MVGKATPGLPKTGSPEQNSTPQETWLAHTTGTATGATNVGSGLTSEFCAALNCHLAARPPQRESYANGFYNV